MKVPDLLGPRDAWNYTGDAYLQDADGYFFYQSRTDMIISAGYNIAAVEVEDVLLRTETWMLQRFRLRASQVVLLLPAKCRPP